MQNPSAVGEIACVRHWNLKSSILGRGIGSMIGNRVFLSPAVCDAGTYHLRHNHEKEGNYCWHRDPHPLSLGAWLGGARPPAGSSSCSSAFFWPSLVGRMHFVFLLFHDLASQSLPSSLFFNMTFIFCLTRIPVLVQTPEYAVQLLSSCYCINHQIMI